MPNFVGVANRCYKVKSTISDRHTFVGVLEKSDNEEGELMHYFVNARFNDGREIDKKDIYDSGVGVIYEVPVDSNACGAAAGGRRRSRRSASRRSRRSASRKQRRTRRRRSHR